MASETTESRDRHHELCQAIDRAIAAIIDVTTACLPSMPVSERIEIALKMAGLLRQSASEIEDELQAFEKATR